MFTPFAFVKQAVSAAPPTPGVPTDGLVFAMDVGDSACYPGSGTTVYDLSSYANTGTLGAGVAYSGDYFTFDTTSTSNLLFGSGAQYGISSTWSYVMYWMPLANQSTYVFEKSNGIDNLSLVYGYDSNGIRPWRTSYHGMNAVIQTPNTLAMVAFTKDENGVTNNYKSYLDTTLQQQLSSDFTVGNNTSGLRFNVTSQDPGDFRVYNFYFYNRALTSQEVSDIYAYVTS